MEPNKFEQLKVSTKTVMAYGNVEMELPKIFEKLPVHEVDEIPLTKKKKRPCIKKIRAPRGKIISLRHKNSEGVLVYRGIVTKPEMVMVTVLRNMITKNGFEQSIVDRLERLDSREQNVIDFLNQLTCIVSLGDRNVNVMIFKDNFKIVGCKSNQDAFDVIKVLWEEIAKIGYIHLDDDPPRFIFDFVMTNVDFELGFTIDRKKLNTLMNGKQFNDLVFKSQYETTGNTNVNIKWYATKSEGFKYWCLEFNGDKINEFEVDTNVYKLRKNKKNKPCYNTFLVFRSSKVILSGRYRKNMRDHYYTFLNIIKNNKLDLEEKTRAPVQKRPIK